MALDIKPQTLDGTRVSSRHLALSARHWIQASSCHDATWKTTGAEYYCVMHLALDIMYEWIFIIHQTLDAKQ